jgi:choline dehydrogenase
MSIGKVLGGGSSINVMFWARGHKSDWDYFAAQAGDPAWSYESVLGVYREIELAGYARSGPTRTEWSSLHHASDRTAPLRNHMNGSMMEGPGGASYFNLRIREGRRRSIFRSYTFPLMSQPNLTVLTGTLVKHVLVERVAAIGVQCLLDGRLHRFSASQEVILSLGAIHTPKATPI